MTSTCPHLLQHTSSARSTAVRSYTHTALLRPFPTPPLVPALIPIIPGVPLTSQLPKPDHCDPRGSVRLLLNSLIVHATGDLCARMCWTLRPFHKDVVLRYGILLYGWPADVPFMNLSTGHGSPSMAQVRHLLALLTAEPQPRMYFVRATPEQLLAAELDISAVAPGPLFPTPVPLPYLGRSNIGRRRVMCNSDGTPIPHRYTRNGPMSAKVISDELDSETCGEASVVNRRRGPLPQMFKDGTWLLWTESGWRGPTTWELLGRWDNS
ncbi:hypothetical protein L226DRAFT_614910 [Lentinus tigrinus ALCF2SS1-7]|uniref:Uncharacterized protein n=1 Tax=Lentinus tigrinus ALCF2SS1-6 TaxID=1328759 RepID=A0A5C2RNJ9_9APHY|nr:hypothetical protein L227DRAFT_658608 [Lentinus tigrinus ALCF2SS1-6]RPD72152.1 hypothetical protein L226DRAFT_614910 [Lentinus tigrinus ALCF2SS1-7]